MIRIIKTGKQVCKVALLLTVMVVWAGGTGLAGEALPKVLPIKPVPDFRTGKSMAPIDKRVSFDGGGRIDRVGKDETGKDLMVINDRLRYLSPSVTYHSGVSGFASPSQFRAGKRVGYLLNKKREITHLYLLGN